jgi:hypothetical protein
LTDESASEASGGGLVSRNLGTLVINVWREAGHAKPLRARLSSRTEDDPEATTSYAADLDTVLAQVTDWYQGLAEAQE